MPQYRLVDSRIPTWRFAAAQFDKVRATSVGIDEGARLVAGGVGRPEGMDRGWFVKPTVFADVTPDATIMREEILVEFCR